MGHAQESSWAIGHKSVLVVRVQYPDDPAEPGTLAETEAGMAEVAQFYRDNSYGQLELESVVTPLLLMPRTWEAYELDPGRHVTLREDALNAARAAGFEPDEYDLDIVLNARLFGLRANIGARGCWLQFPQTDALIHELGHNLGLRHANLWIGRGDTVIGPGRMLAYGNMLDGMADVVPGAWPDRAFNVVHKRLMEWLPSQCAQEITQSGDYRFWASDVSELSSNRIYALRIGKDAEREYWLECRQAWKSNPQVQNGLLLYFAPWNQSGGSACLLDTTPNAHWADDSWDAALLLGRTFSDMESGIHITALQRGSDDGTWMDAHIELGKFPDNRPPEVLVRDGPEAVDPGVSACWQASVADPDGDAVILSWEFGDGTFAFGSNRVTKAWAEPGEYLVRCWASDMKGGQRCAVRAVRVGQPAPERSGRVSGQVLIQGQPAPGVRISVTDSHAVYTDAHGHYLAVGLTNGLYQLHPGGAYLTFEPASRFVVITNGVVLEQNFEASWTATPNNPPYVVTWNPQPGATLVAPASIALRAWAYDDGEISMVQFQDDTGLASLGLGNSFIEVWTNLWSGVATGEHTISVRAFDDFGLIGEGWPTRVTVMTQSVGLALDPLSPPGAPAFRLLSTAGRRVFVEASTNLVDWETIAAVTNQSGRELWSDPEIGLRPRRFYRVRSED